MLVGSFKGLKEVVIPKNPYGGKGFSFYSVNRLQLNRRNEYRKERLPPQKIKVFFYDALN